jgi:tRNA-specific 2-thiouridylase
VGSHQGLAYYTLGQRQGLGIGGTREGDARPWYVAGKDLARNRLLVVQGDEHPLLRRRTVLASDPQWISGRAPVLPARLAAKTRYRMTDAACVLEVRGGGLSARFDTPQWAPTPGQYLVIYDGDVCLGGAVIDAPETAGARTRPEVAALDH